MLRLPMEEAHCSLCGADGPFAPVCPGASLRETRCPACGSSRRTRDLVRVLLACHAPPGASCLKKNLEAFAPLRIWEMQARGPLHDALKDLPGYCCSEYYPDIPPGGLHPSGVLCQDAQNPAFAQGSFTLVISQDVMEHIPKVWLAFERTNRVLAPGGRHIFTVPLSEDAPTRQRARPDADGRVRHMLPPVRHKDPLNQEGALVYWDFGRDLPQRLAEQGLNGRHAAQALFYPPQAIPRVESPEEHARYRRFKDSGRHVLFFLYNSHVFWTEKSEEARLCDDVP